MKISNSKKQLAKIISENGGWRDSEWAAQEACGFIYFYSDKPTRSGAFWHGTQLHHPAIQGSTVPNWHQTILSRSEYFHLYPAPDADGWIEWNGGDCPVGEGDRIDVKFSDGDEFFDVGSDWGWGVDAGSCNIIAYRLHKQADPEFCESVMRSIPEPEAKPTIEQLAADYRNRKDYADRKQQEADAAKADAEAKLAELVAAGKAIGLVVSIADVVPELVINDWHDLQIGDIIEYVDGRNKNRVGMVGRVDRFDLYNADTVRHVRMVSDVGQVGWPTKWRFIRRP